MPHANLKEPALTLYVAFSRGEESFRREIANTSREDLGDALLGSFQTLNSHCMALVMEHYGFEPPEEQTT